MNWEERELSLFGCWGLRCTIASVERGINEQGSNFCKFESLIQCFRCSAPRQQTTGAAKWRTAARGKLDEAPAAIWAWYRGQLVTTNTGPTCMYTAVATIQRGRVAAGIRTGTSRHPPGSLLVCSMHNSAAPPALWSRTLIEWKPRSLWAPRTSPVCGLTKPSR